MEGRKGASDRSVDPNLCWPRLCLGSKMGHARLSLHPNRGRGFGTPIGRGPSEQVRMSQIRLVTAVVRLMEVVCSVVYLILF